MKKIHTPNHKLYEQYYLDQAKQKDGNLPAFHGARFQRGYGLGSIFRGLFRWAVPHLQQGAKMLGKKALQTGVSVAQDVLAGETLKQQQKSVLNKLWAYLPRILRSQVLVKKVQKGKHNQEKAVFLQARNGKHLLSKRNPKTNFPS